MDLKIWKDRKKNQLKYHIFPIVCLTKGFIINWPSKYYNSIIKKKMCSTKQDEWGSCNPNCILLFYKMSFSWFTGIILIMLWHVVYDILRSLKIRKIAMPKEPTMLLRKCQMSKDTITISELHQGLIWYWSFWWSSQDAIQCRWSAIL